MKKENSTILKKLWGVIAPLLIIAAGGGAWGYFKATSPHIDRKPPSPSVALVEVFMVQPIDVESKIQAMGTVIPAREITLRAKVSGEVLTISPQFIPGGRIAKGEMILGLDPADYQVEIQKARSSLVKAQANLAIEAGSQTIAREELRLLSDTTKESIHETDLALRKPQLKQAEAAVAETEADLLKAQLNLDRTIVRAPFNALVFQREVNLGAHVNSQDALATLVGTDEFWVEAAVPVDRLSAFNISSPEGAKVIVHSRNGEWAGRVLQITGKLNKKSRMANVIITVSNPLGHSSDRKMPLLLDEYVNVEIQGKTLLSVIALPGSALRDDDSVWICRNDVLEIREVTLAWKEGDQVYIRNGIEKGDAVVLTDISLPVPGMSLKVTQTVSDDFSTDLIKVEDKS